MANGEVVAVTVNELVLPGTFQDLSDRFEGGSSNECECNYPSLDVKVSHV